MWVKPLYGSAALLWSVECGVGCAMDEGAPVSVPPSICAALFDAPSYVLTYGHRMP